MPAEEPAPFAAGEERLNSVSSPPYFPARTMDWGANALSAPVTPARRLPQVDTSQAPQALKDAAQGMETMFLDYMMKVMRQTVPKNEMDLENPGTEVYRSMLDSETAKTAARSGGVGLAEQMVAYLMSQSYNQPEGHGAPVRVQGGTHEGQPVRK